MAKEKATATAEAKEPQAVTPASSPTTAAANPVLKPDAARVSDKRVTDLAQALYLRRITGLTADGKTPAFWAGKAFDDAQTFWDEADTRNQ